MLDAEFIINVGPQGTFQRSGNYQTIPEDIDLMFLKFESRQVKRIALYFHGGLVNESAGLETARKIAPHLSEANCEPICFVWETGLMEIITTNVSKIWETSFFQETLKYLLDKIISKIGFESSNFRGSSAITEKAYIEEELEKQEPFKDFDKQFNSFTTRSATNLQSLEAAEAINQLENDIFLEVQRDIEKNFELYESLQKLNTFSTISGTANSRGILSSLSIISNVAKVAYNIIKRFINKTDHGIYPTVVEEILRKFFIAEAGALVWNAMKEKSSDMWKNNNGRMGNQKYVGGYFLQKLYDFIHKFPDTEINLIGHSAGSIAICNLFRQSAEDGQTITFNNIIFMAPACRTELFESTIVNSLNRFNNLRIFTMSDEKECKDIMIPFVYTRSLLYLISGALEEKGVASDASILGLERHISYQIPYNISSNQAVHKYLYEEDKDRLCFSETLEGSKAGMQTKSLKHGNFNQDESTIKSIKYILKN